MINNVVIVSGVQQSDSIIHIHISILFQILPPSVVDVVSKSRVTLCTPWTATRQDLLSSSISQSLLKFMSIELVMPSNHLILCRPLVLLPSVFLSIKVFSNELALRIRWPKYWSFSFSISPSKKCSELISFKID